MLTIHMKLIRSFPVNIGFIVLVVGNAMPVNSSVTSIRSGKGITAAVEEYAGQYEIFYERTGWKFVGELGQSMSNVRINRGTDRLGKYQEIRFDWEEGIRFIAGIKVYDSRSIAVFVITPVDSSTSVHSLFPRLTTFPKGLHHFSYEQKVFAPPTFALENICTPWLLFDNKFDAVVISPADNFLVSSMYGDGASEIAAGFDKKLDKVPAHFTRRTVMVFGQGINTTWNDWGNALTQVTTESRPPNDADIGLRYLGYWTDNGATYYYNYDSTLGYEGTLKELVRRYRKEGIPIRYLQLDSWWYDKSFTEPDGSVGTIKNPNLPEGAWNRYGGMTEYRADSMLFPHGLKPFQREIDLPIITHNRWLDPISPYRKEYKVSGVAVIDKRWWNKTMEYLSSADVTCYEQDWLSEIYEHSPQFSTTTYMGSSFLDYMSQAAKSNGMSLQYCMALPFFFLQGSQYSNLTTIRVSDDRFNREKWDNFLYTSQLASALGIWPWTDVFMSSETDNLLLCTLSAGIVGIGDSVGKEDKPNLFKAVRSDGVIVKPDVPIVPADEMYVADADKKKQAMVAWAYTDHGSLRTVYVFVYNRSQTETQGSFLPSSFGLSGNLVVYDAHTGVAIRQEASKPVQFALVNESTAYYVITTVGCSGIAFFGDVGKFVSNGRKRIASLKEYGRELTAIVVFARNEESVRIFGYVRSKPTVWAVSGTISRFSYDLGTKRFEVTISSGRKLMRESPGGDEIKQGVVVLKCK